MYEGGVIVAVLTMYEGDVIVAVLTMYEGDVIVAVLTMYEGECQPYRRSGAERVHAHII